MSLHIYKHDALAGTLCVLCTSNAPAILDATRKNNFGCINFIYLVVLVIHSWRLFMTLHMECERQYANNFVFLYTKLLRLYLFQSLRFRHNTFGRDTLCLCNSKTPRIYYPDLITINIY